MPRFYPCVIIRPVSIIIIVEFSGFMREAFVKIAEQRQREEKKEEQGDGSTLHIGHCPVGHVRLLRTKHNDNQQL